MFRRWGDAQESNETVVVIMAVGEGGGERRCIFACVELLRRGPTNTDNSQHSDEPDKLKHTKYNTVHGTNQKQQSQFQSLGNFVCVHPLLRRIVVTAFPSHPHPPLFTLRRCKLGRYGGAQTTKPTGPIQGATFSRSVLRSFNISTKAARRIRTRPWTHQ